MMRGRPFISLLLIVALLATLGMQNWVRSENAELRFRNARVRPQSRMAGLDSFALGLVLGGLRGPLVMILWVNSETRKSERQLEDVDTQIELIRMLQPEFDSVHIFQMWNKAYNLSAQMASHHNKYSVILDAIEYGRAVDQERPDNVNILYSLGDIYHMKLGSASEKEYYRMRVQKDTQARADAAPSRPVEGRRDRHWTMLDERGFILPELLRPLGTPWSKGDATYTGAELQFLEPYNTADAGGFPYGLSPIALGYNYYQRVTALQQITEQRHLQLGESVFRQPAMALLHWTWESLDRGRSIELQLAGQDEKTIPARDEQEFRALRDAMASHPHLLAGFPDASAQARQRVQEAIFNYRRGASTAAHAEKEFRLNLQKQLGHVQSLRTHIDTTVAMEATLRGDHAWISIAAANTPFKPSLVDQREIPQLKEEAVQAYREALSRWYQLMLKYYVNDVVAEAVYPRVLGPGITRANIELADEKLYPQAYEAVLEYQRQSTDDYLRFANQPDHEEYKAYIDRIDARLKALAQ